MSQAGGHKDHLRGHPDHVLIFFFIIQSHPAISKSQGKWKKVQNSGDFELTEFEIAGFNCIIQSKQVKHTHQDSITELII